MSYTCEGTAGLLARRRSAAQPKGTVLEHDADTCHVVVEGALASCQSLPLGQRQVVGYHLPGDICGLSSIGTDFCDYHIRTLMPSITLPIPAASLIDLASRSSALRHALFCQIGVDGAIARQWITGLGQRSASLRIGHLACELERRLDAIGLAKEGCFQWFGTQSDLGAATGLSVVHVNRSLRHLREEGLVDWTRTVRILDLNRLRAVVGFDPSYLCLGERKLGHLLMDLDGWDDPVQHADPARPSWGSVRGAVNGQGRSSQQ